MKMIKLASILLAGLVLCSCTTIDPVTGEERVSHASAGAGIGAISGAIIGSAMGNTKGAIIGAGLGAVAGGAIGGNMDRQEAMFRQRLARSGVRVIREGDNIRLILPSDITFANDSANIDPHFYRTLNTVAQVMRDFPDTTIKVAGYTSDTGSDMHNQLLSEERAKYVGEYLAAQHVNPNRINAVGYGKRYPVASNASAEGRAQNRRVEITLHAIR